MRAALFSAVALAWCVAAPVQAQDARAVPRILIDRALQERPIQLVGLDDRVIRYQDAGGLLRAEPISEFLALFPPVQDKPRQQPPGARGSADQDEQDGDDQAEPPPPPQPEPQSAMLELADGQRFAGALAAGGGENETVRWLHPVLGVLEFKLDQVARIRLGQAPPAPAAPAPPAQGANDVVLLRNGDRLEGFIESLGGALRFSPGGNGAATDIPLDRIHEITLANPAEAPPAGAIMAWFRDGSIIACRAMKSGRMGELTLVRSLQESEAAPERRTEAAPESPMPLALDDLMAASFDASALTPLASLPPARQEPAGGRRWTRPARVVDPQLAMLGAADIEMPGPMVIEWDLPAGASRLLTTAELPREFWTWGDCELVVSISPADQTAESELARQHLSAAQPIATINAALGAAPGVRRLRFRLEPGEFGPVQDRIILRRPLLLVGGPG